MSFDFQSRKRIDLHRVGSIGKNCFKLFPLGRKNPTQKALVGDASGAVQCFSIRKGAVSSSFKTFPQKKKVSAIEIGSNSKAFVSIGDMVKGYAKKGKELSRVASPMTEDIQHMSVNAHTVYIAGEYVLYKLVKDVETGFYMAPDRINCVITHCRSKWDKSIAILGCQDRTIRGVSENDCLFEVGTGGAVTALAEFPSLEESNGILYGTEKGSLSLLDMNGDTVQHQWSIDGRRAIQAISTYDFTGNGTSDILVGRDDGTVEVYSLVKGSKVPSLVFHSNINDSITSVQGGFFTNASKPDLICSTFSGKIVSYSVDCGNINEMTTSLSSWDLDDHGKLGKLGVGSKLKKLSSTVDDYLNHSKVVGVSKKHRIASLRKEIAKLGERVQEEKSRFANVSSEMIAVSTDYSSKWSFTFDRENSCYRLDINLDIPIDTVAIQCSAPIDIIRAEASNFIISHCETDSKKDGFHARIVLRCAENMTRIEIPLRTVEGYYGELEAFIIPKLTPKSCQMERIHIKPMSFHDATNVSEADDRPVNRLTITGDFTIEQIHGWLLKCFDDIPGRITSDELHYFFVSTFQKTIVDIRARSGEVHIQSDNVSALSILEEYIIKFATEQNTRVRSTNFKLDESTHANVIRLIYPKIDFQLNLSKQASFIEALKEIQMQEDSTEFLTQEYQEILQQERQIMHNVSMQAQRLEFLFSVLLRLMADVFKFRRENPGDCVEDLRKLLNGKEFDLQMLLEFFKAH